MNANATVPTTLRVTRLIKAPRERVFAAWTNPDEIVQWFGPETCKVILAKVDLKAGGSYHFRVRGTDCDTGKERGDLDLRGVYREVKQPSRLVYTWSWHGDPQVEIGETLVTVDFLDKEGFTEVQITHDQFPNTETRDKHNSGWSGTLDKLQRFLGECNAASEPGSFVWNELLTTDMAGATSFYGKVFGWQNEAFGPDAKYTIFKMAGNRIGGMMQKPNVQAPPHWLAYVEVKNVDETLKQAASLGAKILVPGMDIPTVGRVGVLQDPQGAVLGIFQAGRK